MGKKPCNTQRVKDLDFVRRLTRNAAKVASRGRSKPLTVVEFLSESINKAIVVLSFFRAMLLVI